MSRRRIGLLLLAAVIVSIATGRALAHPHVWISVEAKVLYKQGTIVAIQQRWTFDPVYTAMAVDGLDADKDGKLSRDELQPLAKVNMEGLKEFGYFTAVKLAGTALEVETPSEYWLEYGPGPAPAGMTQGAPPAAKAPETKPGIFSRTWSWLTQRDAAASTDQHVLTLVFTLPLKQPVLAEAAGFEFAVRDPSFYIALDPAKGTPVRLSEGAPQGCRAEIGAAASSGDDAQRLAELMKKELGTGGAGVYGSVFRVVCGNKS